DQTHLHAPKVAATGQATAAFAYDPAGQMVLGKGINYTWTPLGLPQSIWRGAGKRLVKEEFSYDGQGSRTTTDLTRGGQSEGRVINIGGLFQVQADASRAIVRRTYKIVGPTGVVAEVFRNPQRPGQNMRFVHQDPLGSPDAVTASGQLL